MKIWITRNSSGLIQMWKYKPHKVDENGNIVFKDYTHNLEGIEVNSLFTDDIETGVCCIERVIM